MTFETFDQSDEKTWPDPKRPTYLHTYPPTYLFTSIREDPKRLILGTCNLWDVWSDQSDEKKWPDPKRPITILCGILNWVWQCALTIATQDNPADLWQLRHWLQFLQLRIWIHDNLCYLTVDSIRNSCDIYTSRHHQPPPSWSSTLSSKPPIAARPAWRIHWKSTGDLR